MKVFHLISSGGVYGAERMMMSLARGLARLGCDSEVAVFLNSRAPNTELAGLLAQENVPASIIACRGRWDSGAVETMSQRICDYGADVVHTHGYKADIYGLAVARRLRLPVVATCHNWTDANLSLRLYGCVDRLALRRFDRAVAVSPQVAERLRTSGVNASRIITVANGVDAEWLRSAAPAERSDFGDPDHLLAGIVGRVVHKKGLAYLLEAACAVIRVYSAITFVIVGNGPDRACFEQQARDLGISSHVRFVGVRTDMASVYRALDLFVLPSLLEAMPMSVLEAMAVGLPVIATSVGAIPELIHHRQTGLLVPPADAGALRDALLTLVADRDLRARLGERASALIGLKYSTAHLATAYRAVYEDVTVHRTALSPTRSSA